jgi:hypothetical protein
MGGTKMFVIGENIWDYIRIQSTFETTWNLYGTCNKIEKVTYKCKMSEATLFQDYETAHEVKEKIKEQKNKLKFENNNIVGELLDRQAGKRFDVEDLKIYELVPTKIER